MINLSLKDQDATPFTTAIVSGIQKQVPVVDPISDLRPISLTHSVSKICEEFILTRELKTRELKDY